MSDEFTEYASIAERKRAAAAEMLRRQRAQMYLHSFALSVNIPLCPVPPIEELDEDLLGPARMLMARVHALILDQMEYTLTVPYARTMTFTPPGCAKSSYANVGAAWALGKFPKHRGIVTGYADDIAHVQSRRIQQICRDPLYRNIWDQPLEVTREAVGDWALSNESELVAAGILGGITGRRANFFFIDDPTKNQEEADSEARQKRVREEYVSTISSRLLPGAGVGLIMTRWNERDLAGDILPDTWEGESGDILCKDGQIWRVLCLQAKCELLSDPLGRKLGEYIWPEFYPARHWQMAENRGGRDGSRVWGSLYQQRPKPLNNEAWDRNWFKWEDPSTWPPPSMMRRFITTDWAVTENQKNDWCAFGAWGIDYLGEWYLLDSFEGQVDTDKSIPAFFQLARSNNVREAFDEKGVIHNAIAPFINKAMKKRGAWRVVLTPMSSGEDKIAKCASFKALASTGIVHLPNVGKTALFADKMYMQLATMPASRWDDHADMAGLAGRVQDIVQNGQSPADDPKMLIPFTAEWLEYTDEPDKKVRYQ